MSLLLYKTRCFYSQTRAKLEHREIKINLSGVFCATPCNKWLITILIQECPRGEIGRHKGLKILARLGTEGTINMIKPIIISDSNKKSLKIVENLNLKYN